MVLPTPQQLGLPGDASVGQYEAALQAAGFSVEDVVATPFPPAAPVVVPKPEPLPEPTTTTVPVEEVVATFRDPSGALYTVTRS